METPMQRATSQAVVSGGQAAGQGRGRQQRARSGTLSSRAGKRRQVATPRKQRNGASATGAQRRQLHYGGKLRLLLLLPPPPPAGCSAATQGRASGTSDLGRQARDGVRLDATAPPPPAARVLFAHESSARDSQPTRPAPPPGKLRWSPGVAARIASPPTSSEAQTARSHASTLHPAAG